MSINRRAWLSKSLTTLAAGTLVSGGQSRGAEDEESAGSPPAAAPATSHAPTPQTSFD